MLWQKYQSINLGAYEKQKDKKQTKIHASLAKLYKKYEKIQNKSGNR